MWDWGVAHTNEWNRCARMRWSSGQSISDLGPTAWSQDLHSTIPPLDYPGGLSLERDTADLSWAHRLS